MKYIMIMVLVLGLSACGSTVVGVGKDIQRWGENWNDSSTEKVPVEKVPVEKVPVKKETK